MLKICQGTQPAKYQSEVKQVLRMTETDISKQRRLAPAPGDKAAVTKHLFILRNTNRCMVKSLSRIRRMGDYVMISKVRCTTVQG